MTQSSTQAQRRQLQGTVVSTAMQKPAVVKVDRQVAHPKYGKYFVVSKKFKVHDEESKMKVGDLVEFEECRPISRDKHWRYVSTLKTAV